jgi:cell division protein FtsQ
MYQSASPDELKYRRQQLRQKRRIKTVQTLWRLLCMGGTIGVLAWLFNQSTWKITQPEQVQIVGNRYLSETAIRSGLSLQYPQWLIQLEPAKIKQKLLIQGGIVGVDVERRLFPPQVTIRVEDRPPVAGVILPANSNLPQSTIDFRGITTPIDRYLPTNRPAPKLKVMVAETGTCPHWAQIYPTIQASPVAIGIVDCRNLQDLRLQTEIGEVRLGSYQQAQRFTAQIQKLDRLRNLPQEVKPRSVGYVDLENPDRPKVQLKEVEAPKPPQQ